MLTAIIIVLAVVVLAIVGVLIYASMQPDSFRLSRSTHIAAPPEKVHALINDFHKWLGWSPWEGLDPQLKRLYSGAETGRGAAYAWEGNNKVGAGRMEITESNPRAVIIKLDFLRPFEAHNTCEFTLAPQAGGTEVVWSMYGPSPFMAKVMHLFFSMDKLVGKDFERGLANLKGLAEK